MRILIGITIIGLICVGQAGSVIMPPRLRQTIENIEMVPSNSTLHEDESIPYTISIVEGDYINVKVESKSSITLNLNRPIPESISIQVLVYSGPELIAFDKSKNEAALLAPSDHQNSKIMITYQANTFGDTLIYFETTKTAGHAEIVCQVVKQPSTIHIDDSSAYISVNIGRNERLGIVISIVGWLYFFAWSLSFYFQVILNYQRKSVIGLNFDFLALNLLGFTCYSIYNFALMFSREVQKDYYQRNAYSRIPVEYNDLFFALHAFLLTLITVVQCFIYERGEQKVSMPAKSFIGIALVLAVGLYIANLFNGISVLDVVLYLSYVKLTLTIIKYTPQAYMNYVRKATTGWSIHNILLDFTGGALSIAQMFLLAYNYNDWTSIFGNFTKFGLGVISISFDIIFVIQHYVLYKQNNEQLETSGESILEPVISRSIRSMSQAQHQSPSSNADGEEQ